MCVTRFTLRLFEDLNIWKRVFCLFCSAGFQVGVARQQPNCVEEDRLGHRVPGSQGKLDTFICYSAGLLQKKKKNLDE